MNTVNFFGHQVTKLIVGDNPLNGHSYIPDILPGAEMVEYYTAERFKETLFRVEELGYNTIMPLADPYVIRILQEYRRAGGKMNIIFQPYPAMDQDVSIHQMMSVDPIGIYHRGTDTDFLYETGQCDKVLALVGTQTRRNRTERTGKLERGFLCGLFAERPAEPGGRTERLYHRQDQVRSDLLPR